MKLTLLRQSAKIKPSAFPLNRKYHLIYLPLPRGERTEVKGQRLWLTLTPTLSIKERVSPFSWFEGALRAWALIGNHNLPPPKRLRAGRDAEQTQNDKGRILFHPDFISRSKQIKLIRLGGLALLRPSQGGSSWEGRRRASPPNLISLICLDLEIKSG